MVNGEMFSFDVRYNILPKMLLLAQNFQNIPRDDEAHPLIISRPDIIYLYLLQQLDGKSFPSSRIFHTQTGAEPSCLSSSTRPLILSESGWDSERLKISIIKLDWACNNVNNGE